MQERIKFEFVEIILRFISRWLVFYHVGHEVSEDAKEYMTDLQYSVQKVLFIRIYELIFYDVKFLNIFQTRDNFNTARSKAEELKSKYMDSKMVKSAYF